MASDQRGSNLTTTALYVGVPVLIGASCYYLYHASKNKNSQSNVGDQSKNKSKLLSPKEHLAQLKQVGNQHFSKKEYEAAIDHYTRALEYCKTQDNVKPDDVAIFYQNRAACNEALGNLDLVLVDCSRAIELKEGYVKAYVRRAKTYQTLGQYDKAMVDAFSATFLDQFQNQANMILADSIVKASSKIKAAEAIKNRTLSWPAAQSIRSYFSAFSCDPIAEKLGTSLNIKAEQLQSLLDEENKPENDANPFSLLVRGSCYSLMRDMSAAREAFDKLLALSDDVCSARYKSNALVRKAAIVVREPSAEGTPCNIEEDLKVLGELLEQAIKIDPDNPDVYSQKSQALFMDEKFEEAIKTLDKALTLKEDFLSAIAQRFYFQFKLATRDPTVSHKKLNEILNEVKETVKKYPNSLEIQQMHAQILTEMNYFEEADQVLINLSKLDPTDGHLFVSRALVQFHLKNDPDEVANLLQEALKIDPKILFAYEMLGSIETQRGNTNEAIKIFDTALRYAQTEAEIARCYGLLDSAKSQKKAAELLGIV